MVNPELDQDRAFDLYDTYRKYGYVMFPQQRRIYEQLSEMLKYKIILEAGCGNGLGTAMLSRNASVTGTDKSHENIRFAQQLYPWLKDDFRKWDIKFPWIHGGCYSTVVAIEVIEHVADAANAIKNLIDAATEEVWISTPNGRGKEKPPSNPHHVNEYTTDEMFEMLMLSNKKRHRKFTVHSWEDLSTELRFDTDVDPLVYRLRMA